MASKVSDPITYFDDFRGDNPHSFLSNFYVGQPILIGTRKYPTGEHAFQAFKATSLKEHNAIRISGTPAQSKAMGRRTELREDWEAVKYDVMRLVLARKFSLRRKEGQLLLGTGDALLVEGNTWNDRVWGVDYKTTLRERGAYERHPGRNWLGALLMARRAELRAAELGHPPFRYDTVQAHVMRGITL